MKLAISSGTLFYQMSGEREQNAVNQAAILMDDGQIFAQVDPAAFAANKMTHAGPDTLKPTDVAIAPSGAYALATNGYIYRYDIGATPEQGRWVKSPDAKDVVAIASDAEGQIWCVNKRGELYHSTYDRMSLDPGNWQKVDAVNTAAIVAGPPQQTIKKLSVLSSRKLDIGKGKYFGPFQHAVAVLTSGGHVYFDYDADNASAGHTASMSHALGEPANLVDIAIGQPGVYGFDTAGNVHGYNPYDGSGRWAKDPDAKNVVGISSDSDGGIWVLNKKGEVYRAMRELGGGIGSWTRMTNPTTQGFWNAAWEYTVAPKDGLYQIIRNSYGVTDAPTLNKIAAEIVRLNKLPNADSIVGGQSLKMPPKSFV